MSKPYNTTQLNPEQTFERHIFHRDQFSHYLRWSHVLKRAKVGMKILDFGCGNANLYEVFYRNRYSPARYVGLDIRKQTIEANKLKFPKAEFFAEDLTGDVDHGIDWDLIISFEVAEHVSRSRVSRFLDNIKLHCNHKTEILISTPCYSSIVGAAKNHIYDGQDGFGVRRQELTRDEMKLLLEERFEILENYGTFASQKDYKDKMNEHQVWVFNKLKAYYDTNILSVMFAPMFPQFSRNNIWYLKKK